MTNACAAILLRKHSLNLLKRHKQIFQSFLCYAGVLFHSLLTSYH